MGCVHGKKKEEEIGIEIGTDLEKIELTSSLSLRWRVILAMRQRTEKESNDMWERWKEKAIKNYKLKNIHQ